ncbi:UDP-N-acetylmuramoyl-L-alanine--D-glutamate ligase [Pelagibacterium xiamenense]|uniref:UDP-N-acetylmuramoyl-L-alanine--D-glutamate ligase n=1 Tax=Pelagibacterium xiamenense TaxID=2901140 RepID=UPI001E29FE35|nr:UDP-N-acetylmuramoyl-L-alanine--D-glutamate ligase [Pelagibacterium xiamenense]MCD7060330.1 UDP-N-acetylmuramoyl-L-alanine--D-glutamate ligase [Pelagibacterium xiamenense]
MRIDGPVLIYGAGREARSTAAFLKKRDPRLELFVTADTGTPELPGATFIPPDAARDVTRFGLIVKSPGVSLYKPFFDTARAAGVPISSNLNLWAAHFREGRTVIAITGTKGKSTTATLVHLMLAHSGVDAILAGNVGIPPLDAADKAQLVVFELSSYQTADIDFAPDIAALTNLYPEHVDWHGSVERYYADKLNLFARGPARIALGRQAEAAAPVGAAITPPSQPVAPLDARLEAEIAEAAASSRLKGAHNHENARLAAMIAIEAGATREGVLAGIAAFVPLPHRLEELNLGNILFVDDSISTTPEATKAALAAYKGKRIALIAGGHERQQDYTELAGLLGTSGVVMLCCLPVTGTRLARATREAAPQIPVAECRSLEGAIQMLAGTGAPFDTVILSPGAPSYNQFANFEERGKAFKALAQAYFSGSEHP